MKHTTRSTLHGSFLLRLFVLLSLADLALTAWLLSVHPEWVVESNPVAAWWLARFGLAGLAVFKVATVVVVGLICRRLLRSRPVLGHGVLAGACLVVLTVVGYSSYLAHDLHGHAQVLDVLEREGQTLDVKHAELQAYHKMVNHLVNDLVANRLTLKEVVNQMSQSDRSHDPVWVNQMKVVYGSDSLEICLAKSLLRRISSDTFGSDPNVLQRLEEQFTNDFGDPVLADSTTDTVSSS
jgi:hypothetical protein